MGKKKSFWEKKMTRREFVKKGLLLAAGIGVGAYALGSFLGSYRPLSSTFKDDAPPKLWKWSREAYHYSKLGANVQCHVCPNQCILEENERSVCRTKVNKGGKLYTLAYGNPCAVHVDPIEKKPLFHFLPSTLAFSIATAGCNFRCKNCFVPGTFVITENGLREIDDLVDSGVNGKMTVDGSIVKEVKNERAVTHTGEVLEIIHGFTHPYDGDVLIIKPHHAPEIKCTPGHEFFVRNKKGRVNKLRAGELKEGDYVLLPKKHEFPRHAIRLDLKEIISTEITKFRRSFRLSEGDIRNIMELSAKGVTSKEIGKMFGLHPAYVRTLRSKFRSEASMFRDNVVIERNGKIKFKTEKFPLIPRYVKLDKDFARLLGYYCGEGCVYKGKNRPNSYVLLFTFGRKEEELAEETTRLIKKIFGVAPSVRETRTNITVSCGKASVALIFKNLCGSKAKEKTVPLPLNRSPKTVVHEFLRAYIRCDGCVQKEEISVSSVSKKLALGVYWLLLKTGFLPSFYEWEPKPEKTIEGRRVKQSRIYYVKLKAKKFRDKFLFPRRKIGLNPKSERSLKFLENGDYYFVPISRITREKYTGYVYNLEVGGHHSYLANFIAVGNCQNWEISQFRPEDTKNVELFPEDVVKNALAYKCASIAYTYSEPTAFYEYMYDTSKLASSHGIKNLWITNGYMSEEALRDLCKYLDAANVDLKSFREEIYNTLNAGRLQPVLDTLKILKSENVWFEITNLVIPTYTDDFGMIREMCEWIARNLGRDYPFHFSRFHPEYKLKHLPPTPVKTLEKAREIAMDVGLKFVYIGNVPGHEGENTYCPHCGKIVIERKGYSILQNHIENDSCAFCGEPIAGVWKL